MASVISSSCICPQVLTQQPRIASRSPEIPKVSCSSSLPSSTFFRKQSLKQEENILLKGQNGEFSGRRTGICWAQAGFSVKTVAVSDSVSTSPMGLQVVETDKPNSRVQLSVTVPANVCKTAYNEVIKEFSKKAKVPGFRPGKRIPENVLVNYIGVTQVKSSAVEAILKKTLGEALSSVAGIALKESEHITSKFQDLEASFSPDAALSYDVTVDVAPEIKWTSEKAYRNLKVSVELESDSTPEQNADKEFRSKLKDLGSLRVKESGGLEMGDVGIIDVSCNRVNPDGTLGDRILSAEQKGFQLDTEDSANFLPGFVEALIGINRDETREFKLVFPETWSQEFLRGIHAQFTGVCKEVFIRRLPEVDDSLAPKLLEGCTTIEQVKTLLLQKHEFDAAQAKKQATHFAIAEELAKVVIVDVPHSLLEEQGRQMYAAKLIELQAKSKLSKEQVYQLSNPEMVANYLQAQKEKIEDTVKQTLAVAKIFKLENLQYSEEELNSEIENAIAEFKRYNQEYDEKRIREQAEELLEGTKVMDWLVANSQIEYGTAISAPRSSVTVKQATYSGFQGGSDSNQRLKTFAFDVGASFDVRRRLGLTSMCRKWEGVATIKTKRNVGKRLSIGVARSQHPRMNVVAKDASAPADLQDFICGGALATKVGATPERVAENVDEWYQLGTQLAHFLKFDEGGLSEIEKIRIYQYYLPVYFWVRDQLAAHRSSFTPGQEIPPLVVGISAPQGCGKTTIVESLDYLLNATGRPAAAVSVDDFYLTADGQEKVAATFPGNSLLELRGNAGSHDLQLGTETLESLLKLTSEGSEALIPRYNKAARSGRGDRADPSKWTEVKGPLQVVLFEGWMLGFEPQSEEAVTAVSPELAVVNENLKEYDEAWYKLINSWLIIQVGNTDWVYEWRLEAEVHMRQKGKGGMTDEEVADFVSRYIPAYKAYLPSLYSKGPVNSTSANTLRLDIDQERNPIG
ncbi:hypothetical protein R1sor_013072 [Riccia sorocarpa]|uniref:peptidylprolyl isomerase n=1 Tax=Riccia sorocarpa TaxID=122646 RepID=A0ABD3H5G8_9MARC